MVSSYLQTMKSILGKSNILSKDSISFTIKEYNTNFKFI